MDNQSLGQNLQENDEKKSSKQMRGKEERERQRVREREAHTANTVGEECECYKNCWVGLPDGTSQLQNQFQCYFAFSSEKECCTVGK